MSNVILTVGLSYGDEGKGTTVDFLCRHFNADLVVRYNGGSQAAHNVVLDTGGHHCFSQWGAGTFAGARTYLSEFMLVNPIAAFAESRNLERLGIEDPFARLFVSEDALVTTPYHIAANRLLEMKRALDADGPHGSCGMGIGTTMWHANWYPSEALHVRDFESIPVLFRKLRSIRERLAGTFTPEFLNEMRKSDLGRAEVEILEDAGKWCEKKAVAHYREFNEQATVIDGAWFRGELTRDSTIVFEGAQGVLLDQDYGFQPHTTWTRCTLENANQLLDGYRGDVHRLGILRAYSTRHGAGPFVAEDPTFDICSADDHNGHGQYQGKIRSGAFDAVATKYALDVVGGVDAIAVTRLDSVMKYPGEVPFCYGYANGSRQFPTMSIAPGGRPPSYEAQVLLTQYLFESSPVLGKVSVESADHYLGLIVELLKTPCALVSHGPQFGAKQWRGW